MMKNNYLFKVHYQGTSNNHFVNGNIYKVLEIDEEGDYLVLDEFLNPVHDYKSKFAIYKESREKIKVIGNTIGLINKAIIDRIIEAKLSMYCETFKVVAGAENDIVRRDEHFVVVNIKPSDDYKYMILIGTVKVNQVNHFIYTQSNSDFDDVIKIQNFLLEILELQRKED